MSQKVKRNFEKAMKFKEEGKLYCINGYIQFAIEKFSKAIEFCPLRKPLEKAACFYNRSVCYDALQDWDKVVADSTEAIKLNIDYEKAFKRRINAYKQLGQLRLAAIDCAVLCLRKGEERNEFYHNYNDVLESLSYNGANIFLGSVGDLVISDEMLQFHFEHFSSNGFVTGIVTQKIINGLLDHLASDTLDVQSVCKLNAIDGTIKFLKLRYSEANLLFKKVVETNCSKELKVYCYIMLARCSFNAMLFGLKNETGIKEAIEYFDNALVVDAKNGDVYFHKLPLLHYIHRKGINNLIENLSVCINYSPNNVIAKAQRLYYSTLRAFYANNYNEMNQAFIEFSSHLKLNRNSTVMLFYYTISLLHTFKDSSRLRECFNFALELDEKENRFKIYKAFVYLNCCEDNNHTDEIIQLFNDSVSVNECQYAHAMLAKLHIEKLNLEYALQHLSKATKLSRTHEDCMKLAKVLELINTQFSAIRVMDHHMEARNFAFSLIKSLSVDSFDEIANNWVTYHLYNGLIHQTSNYTSSI